MMSSPSVGARIGELFDHVLVDEYQDTNALQADILLSLRKSRPNITVVGDDAQSIYSFWSATIANILDFPTQHPGTEIITLERNYRSTRPILESSNAVIAQATKRHSKELWTDREKRGEADAHDLSGRESPVPRGVQDGPRASRARHAPQRTISSVQSGPPQHHAGVRVNETEHPVRKVRRLAFRGGRSREGRHGVPSNPREPARRTGVVPGPAAHARGGTRRRSPDHGRGRGASWSGLGGSSISGRHSARRRDLRWPCRDLRVRRPRGSSAAIARGPTARHLPRFRSTASDGGSNHSSSASTTASRLGCGISNSWLR